MEVTFAAWGLGATIGERAIRLLARGRRARQRVEWARVQLRERGALIVVVARFIPGGRTATTLAAGMLGMRWRRFAAADAIGASLWGAFAAMLGYVGGETFEDSLWMPLAASAAAVIVVASLGECWRRRRV